MSCVALVGLPGSGKSTLSKHLAKTLGYTQLDTDAVIEEFIGCSISHYFQTHGEAAFRQLETQTLEEIFQLQSPHQPASIVLATGGGIVLRAENRALLQAKTHVVYLHAQPEQLYQRLRHDRSRPLLQGAEMLPKLRQLYEQRHALYTGIAHLQVESTLHAPAAVCDAIVQAFHLPSAVHD